MEFIEKNGVQYVPHEQAESYIESRVSERESLFYTAEEYESYMQQLKELSESLAELKSENTRYKNEEAAPAIVKRQTGQDYENIAHLIDHDIEDKGEFKAHVIDIAELTRPSNVDPSAGFGTSKRMGSSGGGKRETGKSMLDRVRSLTRGAFNE